MNFKPSFWGELLGSFILVFIGCGSVVATVIMGWIPNLFTLSVVFGSGVSLGIIASRKFSGAHLNPAVTLAMALIKKLPARQILPYLLGQFAGAFLGAGLLFLLFQTSIAEFEAAAGVLRGSPASIISAQVFGEFYPNPGFADEISIGAWGATGIEAIGAFLLMASILVFAFVVKTPQWLFPWLIGTTVTVLIYGLAPYTQAGFNPARDLAPRLFSAMAGWGGAVLPDGGRELLVYGLGPVIGAALAGIGFHIKIWQCIKPFRKQNV